MPSFLQRMPLVAVGLGLIGALAALGPRTSLAAGNTPVRLVVVDMQRAAMETEDGLRAQATLRKFQDRRQGELKAREDDLIRQREDLEKQSKVLSKEAVQKQMEDLQKKMSDMQGMFVDYDRELRKRQAEVTAPIFGRVAGLLRKLAQRDGYDLILDRQAVPYARAELDVTDSVIVMYNSGEEPAPEPAAPPPSGSPPAASARPAPSASAPSR
jgi:outer membrane protein